MPDNSSHERRRHDRFETDVKIDFCVTFDLKTKVEMHGKSSLEWAQTSKQVIEKSVKDLTKELADEEAEIIKLSAASQKHLHIVLSVGEAYREWRAGTISFTEALKLGPICPIVSNHCSNPPS